jgi:hypothetical protein
MIGDATSLKAALNESAAAVDSFSSTTTSRLDQIVKKYSTFGLAVGGVMTGAGFAMVQFGAKSEEARLILEQSLTNAGFAFDDYAVKIDDVITKMEHYGYSNDEAMTALDRLVNATHDPNVAITDLGIAADIAANRHWSLTEAATQLARALSGSPLIFRQFGINIAVMKTETKAAAKAQTEASSAHDHYASALRRYNDLLDVWNSKSKHSVGQYDALKNAAADLAKAQKDLKDKTDAANASAAKVSNVQAQIQQAVAATAAKVSGDAAKVSGTFYGQIEGWKQVVSGFFSGLSNSLGPAVLGIGAVVTATSGLVATFQGSIVWIESMRASTLAAAAAEAELRGAMALEAVTAEDVAAKDQLVASAQAEVAATATGASGKLMFLTRGMGAFALAAGGAALIGHQFMSAQSDSVNSGVTDMNKLLGAYGRTGAGADQLGYKIHGIGTESFTLNDAFNRVADNHWWDQLEQNTAGALNSLSGGFLNLDSQLGNSQGAISQVDAALANMVQSGDVAGAADAVQRITDEFAAQGKPIADVIGMLSAYQAALAAVQAQAAAAYAAPGMGGSAPGEHSGTRIGTINGGVTKPKAPAMPRIYVPNFSGGGGGGGGGGGASAATQAANQAIQSVTQGLQQAVANSKAALQQIADAAKQMATSVAQSIAKYASVVSTLPAPWATTGSNIAAQMVSRAHDIKAFYANIKKLRAEGLNATSLSDIINAGVEQGGAIAAALVGDMVDIKTINAAQRDINNASQAVGNVASQVAYADQIKVAKAHLHTSEKMLTLWQKELKTHKGDIHINVSGSVLSEQQLWQIVQKYANRYWGRNGQAGTKP